MDKQELQTEEKTIAEQQCDDEIAADAEVGPICPLEPNKPWEESVCGLMEQRVMEQIMQRLKAEQAPEEVVAPAAEIEQDDPTAAENS